MYDSVAILKRYTDPTYDEYGNEQHELETVEVFVQPRSVYASEFYNAAQLGLKPSITLVMTNREDYDGQKLVEYEGVDYNVIRTDWNSQRDSISLICEERIGDAGNTTGATAGNS